MTRALLAIGCDKYSHLKPLTGAENDARQLFELLIRPEVGDYDQIASRLLPSPTLQEIRDTLTAILFASPAPETVTVCFAGHGAVNAGSFYMAARDSRPAGLSATALSLGDLFRMLAEARPFQSYVIIDACEAGGLTADLNVILKSDIMGQLGSPSISLLATAAADESALEEDGGGVGTRALLDCIRGNLFIQDARSSLDLVEIGRTISSSVSQAGGQTPVVWGLNLYAPPSFCKNPHAGTGNAPLRSVLAGWTDAGSADLIRQHLPRLWEPYVAVASNWNPRQLVDPLTPILFAIQSDTAALISFVGRIDDASLGPVFLCEAAAALPVEADPSLDDIYTALEWRRLRLRQDQQVPEWTRLRNQTPALANAAGASLP